TSATKFSNNLGLTLNLLSYFAVRKFLTSSIGWLRSFKSKDFKLALNPRNISQSCDSEKTLTFFSIRHQPHWGQKFIQSSSSLVSRFSLKYLSSKPYIFL